VKHASESVTLCVSRPQQSSRARVLLFRDPLAGSRHHCEELTRAEIGQIAINSDSSTCLWPPNPVPSSQVKK
jgi:hypothetical protein